MPFVTNLGDIGTSRFTMSDLRALKAIGTFMILMGGLNCFVGYQMWTDRDGEKKARRPCARVQRPVAAAAHHTCMDLAGFTPATSQRRAAASRLRIWLVGI